MHLSFQGLALIQGSIDIFPNMFNEVEDQYVII